MKRHALPIPFRRALSNLRRSPVVFGLCCSALLAGCESKAPPAAVAPTVDVITVAAKDEPIYREWIGTMDGNINATIRPQVSGYLLRQNYREGEPVKKGQVLFEIDPRTFQAALDQAAAARTKQAAIHTTAAANLARVKPLAEKNALSQKDLDDAVGNELSARAGLEQSNAALETAKLNLGFTRITSPIDGIAGIAKAQIGDLLSPTAQTELTTVSSLDPIKVYISLSERELLRYEEERAKGKAKDNRSDNIPLELILVDGSIHPEKGRFALADRQIDPTTGTLKIGALFPNPGNRLRPGQFAKIRATFSVQKDALLVPQRAVTEIQGRYLIAVVGEDNKIEIRPVKPGDRIGSDWIINEGLKVGERVVVEGTQKVRPGAVVTPKPFSAEGAAPAQAAAPAKKD